MSIKSKSIAESHPLKIKIVALDDVTTAERKIVLQLLASLSTIKDVETAARKLESVHRIGLAKYNGTVYGVAVLRNSDSNYVQKLVDRSGVRNLPTDSLELVWIAVKPSIKSYQVEADLIDTLIDHQVDTDEGKRIFAVYGIEDEYVNPILEHSKLVKHDHDHEALVGGKRVQLWLLP